MAWFKVDDHLTSHPAVFKVGDEALGYWMRLGCWLAQFPDQGDVVPDVIADMLMVGAGRRKRRKLAILVEAGMLIPVEGGYRMYSGLDICGSGLDQDAWEIEKTTTRRPSIGSTLRALIVARDGYVCQLCYTEVDPSDVHLDHVKPFSKGGPTTLDNLRVTHSVCNMRKGAKV